MPIVHQVEERFPSVEMKSVWHLHRLAVLFGLVFPLVIFLTAGLRTGNVMLWPSVLIHLYEHTYLTSWLGIYLFGLFAFMFPALLDRRLNKTERRTLMRGVNVFALGGALIIGGGLLVIFWPRSSWLGLAGPLGSLGMLLGWLVLQYEIFRWFMKTERKVDLHLYAAVAGLVFFSAALLMHLFADVMLWQAGRVIFPQSWLFSMRSLPIIGIGFMLLSFLLRLAPEMLGWRPLPDRRLKQIYSLLLIAALLVTVGYPYFHTLLDIPSSIIFGIGSFLGLVVVVWLLLSIDLWHIRLTPSMNTEHIVPIYSSLVWLLLSAGYFVVATTWEIQNHQSLLPLWIEPLMYAIIGGFFTQAVFGLYTYLVNQLEDSHGHSERLTMVASVMINWALLLRVFVYPFMIAYGWEGALVFRIILDGLLYMAVFLASFDVFHALGGHHLIWRSLLKK